MTSHYRYYIQPIGEPEREVTEAEYLTFSGNRVGGQGRVGYGFGGPQGSGRVEYVGPGEPFGVAVADSVEDPETGVHTVEVRLHR